MGNKREKTVRKQLEEFMRQENVRELLETTWRRIKRKI
jgi:hypothetical protein